ncbi:hypothetical protein [Rubellicoccus peritrichatus]|uniref:Uncharacterized protein n=1 Tax=Rubellicoccus peritrichatus TaxID=3080537 RepID=A0AAQ3LF69_9BACT|nr:hypothetical protein [Puniceicoccus sp. CR14]WOO40834.1 hypothetical protein RZN69_19595 [Puniceicoccus sp. CR14]
MLSGTITITALLLTLFSGLAFGYTNEEFNEANSNPASFTVNGDRARMNGFIDGSTPSAVDALLANNPNVTAIDIYIIPGSDNDNANLQASRKIRAAGLHTHVLDNGGIFSGGVDFFLAGATRSLGSNVEVGVHPWRDGSNVSGADYPMNSPAHDLYLDYYAEMKIDADFYWFTLTATPNTGIPGDDIHLMSAEEIDQYAIIKLVADPIDNGDDDTGDDSGGGDTGGGDSGNGDAGGNDRGSSKDTSKIVNGASPIASDWFFSSWFASFYAGAHPWLFQENLGWFFVVGDIVDPNVQAQDETFWMFDLIGNTWIWSGRDVYPFFFDAAPDGGWRVFFVTDDGLFIFNSETNAFVERAAP